MYSEDDINSAVDAGALSADAAASFRAHMTKMRELPRGSEEDFRLINSFNDIFVAIGVLILLFAAGAIGQEIGGVIAPPVDWFTMWDREPSEAEWATFHAARHLNTMASMCIAGLLVAAVSWPLAEFFTRKRRMALPSIILLLAFVGGTFATLLGATQAFIGYSENGENGTAIALAISASALIAAGAAFLHWRRFMVPITVAVGAGAAVATVIALLFAGLAELDLTDNAMENIAYALILTGGLVLFALAMRWDMSDRERVTRRSDVAFWLHLLAAPMIAHPIFAMLGVLDADDLGMGAAFGVLGIYVAFGLLALAVDRRALLVSALIYVLWALASLFREFGAVELGFALTALVIGSALLSLSAFWQPIRSVVVGALPEGLQAKLPATQDPVLTAAPPQTA